MTVGVLQEREKKKPNINGQQQQQQQQQQEEEEEEEEEDERRRRMGTGMATSGGDLNSLRVHFFLLYFLSSSSVSSCVSPRRSLSFLPDIFPKERERGRRRRRRRRKREGERVRIVLGC